MKTVPALLLAGLLLAPLAAAEKADPAYPPELVALLPGWIAEAEALVREGDRDKAWWPEAESFLTRAKQSAEDGRFRVTTFHLETFTELVLSQQVIAQAKQQGSAAEQRTAATQQTQSWKADAEDAWLAFRARVHAYDGQLRSLQAIEKVVYASDMAINAAGSLADHEFYAQEMSKQPGLPEPYVLALVRASHTPLLALGYAEDVLDAAIGQEGLPPRANTDMWGNLTTAALNISGEAPAYLKDLDELARPSRENGEGIMAVAFWLAEQRASRLSSMQTMFGDAASRDQDVLRDAARGMNNALNNTSIQDAHDRSLSGIFTADAVDRARQTNEYHADGRITYTTVLVAWAGLEHAGYVWSSLGHVSPTPPQPSPTTAEADDHPIGKWWDGYRHRDGLPNVDYYEGATVEEEPKGTPAPAILAILGVAAVVALLRRR